MLTQTAVSSVLRQLTSGFANAPSPPVQPHVLDVAFQTQELYGPPHFWAGWRDPARDSIKNGDHPAGLALDYYLPRVDGGYDMGRGLTVAMFLARQPMCRYTIWHGWIYVAHSLRNGVWVAQPRGWQRYQPPAGEGIHTEHVHYSSLPASASPDPDAFDRPVHPFALDSGTTPTPPSTIEEEDMLTIVRAEGHPATYLSNGVTRRWLRNERDYGRWAPHATTHPPVPFDELADFGVRVGPKPEKFGFPGEAEADTEPDPTPIVVTTPRTRRGPEVMVRARGRRATYLVPKDALGRTWVQNMEKFNEHRARGVEIFEVALADLALWGDRTGPLPEHARDLTGTILFPGESE